MKINLFSDSELVLLEKAEKLNSDELFYWRMPNVIYPFIVILISIVAFTIFKPTDKFSMIGLLNLLFNGSLPLIALSRISSIGGNLFKFNKHNENLSNTNTIELRIKIDDYSKFLILSIAFLYIYQVINAPFINSWWLIFQFILSCFFIFYSLRFSKYAYLLQERLMERTIGDEIKESAKQNKDHLSEKYG
jgi:hypothetical protein